MKRKPFFALLLLVLLTAEVFSKTQEVCDSCRYTRIQQAIEDALAGDTVLIKAGTYVEYDLLIDKPLCLLGEEGAIIDGDKQGYILKVLADSVTISGLKLQNVGQSYTKDFAAIYISKSHNFVVENTRLEQVFFGILVEKSKWGNIRNNYISSEAKDETSSGNGIHLWHSSEVLITQNEVHQMRDGIYLEFVKDSKITHNNSYGNLRYGLHFMFSDQDEYHDNVFMNNGAGVAVMFSKFITMKRNRFVKNWGTASYGLLLKEIYDAEIEDNTFEQNTIGINVEGTTRVNYKNNDFLRNGWAVKIAGACYANHFTHNNFLYNSFDIAYNSKLNDNSFDENYWSDYTGYDLDRDGVGDVPYRPVKLFSYIVNQTPETIVLLRSLFVDMINFSEKVSPVFTPDNLLDNAPQMHQIK